MELNPTQIQIKLKYGIFESNIFLNNFYSETNGIGSQRYQLNPCTR